MIFKFPFSELTKTATQNAQFSRRLCHVNSRVNVDKEMKTQEETRDGLVFSSVGSLVF